MAFKLGVDVGGTFTDVLLINSEDGNVHTAKVPSQQIELLEMPVEPRRLPILKPR